MNPKRIVSLTVMFEALRWSANGDVIQLPNGGAMESSTAFGERADNFVADSNQVLGVAWWGWINGYDRDPPE